MTERLNQKARVALAYKQGRMAHKKGLDKKANPFAKTDPCFGAWAHGYKDHTRAQAKAQEV